MAETICIESAKPITMTSGVMTLRNRLSLKPIEPSMPSDQSCDHRRERRNEHQGQAAERRRPADGPREQEPKALKVTAIALDAFANSKLHELGVG